VLLFKLNSGLIKKFIIIVVAAIAHFIRHIDNKSNY